MAKVQLPAGGTLSGVIGTIDPNGAMVYSSLTAAVNEVSFKVAEAIETQNHSSPGELPDLVIQFKNGSTAIMPASVYVRDGEALTNAGRSSIIRKWIGQNCPEEFKGKRLYVAIYAHHSAIWGGEHTP